MSFHPKWLKVPDVDIRVPDFGDIWESGKDWINSTWSDVNVQIELPETPDKIVIGGGSSGVPVGGTRGVVRAVNDFPVAWLAAGALVVVLLLRK